VFPCLAIVPDAVIVLNRQSPNSGLSVVVSGSLGICSVYYRMRRFSFLFVILVRWPSVYQSVKYIDFRRP